MRWVAVALLLPFTISCGRTALVHQTEPHDAARRVDASASNDPLRDAAADPPSDRLPERSPADVAAERPLRDLLTDAVVRDLGGSDPPAKDALSAGRADSGGATPCSALQALADRGVLTRGRTTAVAFAPDRSWVALRASSQRDTGGGSELVRVRLPSGELTIISGAGESAEALGPAGAMLVVGGASTDQRLAVYENGVLRTLATGACAHQAMPEGGARLLLPCDRGFHRSCWEGVTAASRPNQATY